MQSPRWFAAVVLVLIGVAFLAAGALTLVHRDWHPTRALGSDELNRVSVAAVFVESSAKSLGRMPSMEEFRAWSLGAPSELRLEGVGFTYAPSGLRGGSAYAFYWYGGRGTWLAWRSDASDYRKADIAPSVYFLLGSKPADLFVFFGIGIAALGVARRIVRAESARHTR